MGSQRQGMFERIGPGLLIAATGVGAGDLATAAFAGQHLGMTVLWAVLLGAGLKFALNEGLARFQLYTGQTLLDGAATRYGRIFVVAFMLYLVFWTFFVARALMLACGAAAAAIMPLGGDLQTTAIIFGAGQSLLALLIVQKGSFQSFERLMMALILGMFVIVLVLAACLVPSWSELGAGLIPSAQSFQGEGLGWTVALLGGVGGTVTVLCYGYWLREQTWARTRVKAIAPMRIDLLVGYLVTGLFGLAMVVIGSQVPSSGKGVGLLLDLSNQLERELGSIAGLVFLFGAWGAVFSSMLGVWQAVPYLFADLWGHLLARPGTNPSRPSRRSRAYVVYACLLATLPMAGLFGSFRDAQKLYGIVGAAFMPILALGLLHLAGQRGLIRSKKGRNGRLATGCFLAALVFFLYLLGSKLWG